MKKFIAIMLVCAMAFSLTGCKASDYKKAVKDYEAGEYAAAMETFTALADYKDSADYVTKCEYKLAEAAFDRGEYAAAYETFAALGDYEYSAEYAWGCVNETLQGEWISADVEMLDFFLAKAVMSDQVETLLDYCNIDSFKVRFILNFDGENVKYSADEESLKDAMTGVAKALAPGMIAYMKDAIVETTGLAGEAILKVMQVASDLELFEKLFGMSPEDFVISALAESDMVSSMAESSKLDGGFEIDGTDVKISFSDDSQEYCSLSFEDMTFTMTGENVSGDERAVYPIVFTKAD